MKHILLVDDDPNLLSGLLRQFAASPWDWRVSTAPGGRAALRLAGEQRVDLLVTDILMPEMDGLETIREFRREHPGIRIIAMSGGGRRVGRWPLGHAVALGADVILEKPFEFAAFCGLIAALLGEATGAPSTGAARSVVRSGRRAAGVDEPPAQVGVPLPSEVDP